MLALRFYYHDLLRSVGEGHGADRAVAAPGPVAVVNLWATDQRFASQSADPANEDHCIDLLAICFGGAMPMVSKMVGAMSIRSLNRAVQRAP